MFIQADWQMMAVIMLDTLAAKFDEDGDLQMRDGNVDLADWSSA